MIIIFAAPHWSIRDSSFNGIVWENMCWYFIYAKSNIKGSNDTKKLDLRPSDYNRTPTNFMFTSREKFTCSNSISRLRILALISDFSSSRTLSVERSLKYYLVSKRCGNFLAIRSSLLIIGGWKKKRIFKKFVKMSFENAGKSDAIFPRRSLPFPDKMCC